MDRDTQSAIDLQTLRALCNGAATREERLRLLGSLDGRLFLDPEHQVVLESLRTLLPRGTVSVERLRVHLNNRGFPDTNVEKYFEPELTELSRRERAGKAEQ